MLDVEILLQRADMGAVLTRLGLEWERRKSKRGHELYFACPTNNHQDDPLKKRCSVSEIGRYKGMVNCWACDFRGNLIHLIRFVTKCQFKQALSFLERDYGTADVLGIDALKFRLKMNKGEDKIVAELPTFELPDDYRLLTKARGHDADVARNWLKSERHINPDAMDRFEIGIAHHPGIGAAVVIPVRFRGKIHSVFWAQPFKGGLKRYPKNSPQGEILFNYDRCVAAGSYIMMESILDVIKFECVVGRPAMACFTNMISNRQIDLIRGIDEHGVMPDLDGARGWDLVQRMVPHLGKGMWIYLCPIGKDPGDCTPGELIVATHRRIRYCDYEFSQIQEAMRPHVPKIKGIRKK